MLTSVSPHLEVPSTSAARPSGYCFQPLSIIKPYNFAYSFPICLQINTARTLLPPSLKGLKSKVHLRLMRRWRNHSAKQNLKLVFSSIFKVAIICPGISKKGHGTRMIFIQSLLLRIAQTASEYSEVFFSSDPYCTASSNLYFPLHKGFNFMEDVGSI